jgi:hypothetical protein
MRAVERTGTGILPSSFGGKNIFKKRNRNIIFKEEAGEEIWFSDRKRPVEEFRGGNQRKERSIGV